MALCLGAAGEDDFEQSFEENKEDFLCVERSDLCGDFPVDEFHSAVEYGLSLSGFVVEAEAESFDDAVPVLWVVNRGLYVW